MKFFLIGMLLCMSTWPLFAQNEQYPEIVNNSMVLTGDKGHWDDGAVHTFSIVEANMDGFKYWAYYALDHYERDPHMRKAGLARSNDLMNWEKYDHNPIINNNCRWPTVVFQNETFYMFYAEYNEANDSRIVMMSSKNGLDFDHYQVVVPYQTGEQNQNPFIYFNEQDQQYYLFYYNGTERAANSPRWNIHVKKAKQAQGLAQAKGVEIISAKATLAAPSVAYFDGTYYMLVEEFDIPEDKWVTNAFYSDKVDSGYKRVTNNPVLEDNDACAFQHVFNNKLYVSYSHCLNLAESIWNLRIITLESHE